MSEIYLAKEYLLYILTLESGIMFDVGGHEGGSTAVFAPLPEWSITAFEPENDNRKVFESKFSNKKNVVCVPKAVTDKAGEQITFYVSTDHFGIHSIKPFHDTHKPSQTVITTTINETAKQQGIEKIDFIKTDTEGADFLALKGCDLKKYSPEIIVMEFMDHRSMENFGYDHHDVCNYMQERGYTGFISAWEEMQAYAKKGEKTSPHKWLGLYKYGEKQQTPYWGNLIFIKKENEKLFQKAFRSYLRKYKIENLLTKLPLMGKTFRFLKRKNKW